MKFDRTPARKTIEAALAAVRSRGVKAELVPDRAAALARLVDLIPPGSSLMMGASVTLDQIGFVDLIIAGSHNWINLRGNLLAEPDPARQAEMRRQATLAEFFLGSVHAITVSGQLVTASATGSQLPGYAFSSPNVVWVAGAQKIVPGLDGALDRIREYVMPLEDARMKSTGAAGTALGKMLIFERETNPWRHVRLILVDEVLGY